MTDVIINLDCLDALRQFPDDSINCCVTSPPYYALRDYGMEGQIGREETPELYIDRLTEVFREVRRVLAPNGTLWLNIADTYAGKGDQGNCIDPKYPRGRTGQSKALNNKVEGCKPKDMIGIPWKLAFALRDDGWYLRSDIIWHKANPMPESVRDRPSRCYEHIFLLSKSRRYFYDADAISEPVKDIPKTRNRRDVWQINTFPFKGSHFAAFPPKLAETCILAGCPEGGVVLDPFFGSGTTGLAAKKLGRQYIGIELNPDYCKLAEKRIRGEFG